MTRHTYILILLLCIPVSLWAMTPVADDELSSVTGRAGVNINADLTMNITIGTMAWGDASGIDTGFAQFGWGTADTTAGYVGVTNLTMTGVWIKSRDGNPVESFGDGYLPDGTYVGGHTGFGYTTLALKPITIDVGSGSSHGGATFVRFGLGSLQVFVTDMTMNVALGTSGTSLNQVLGSVNIGNMRMWINPTSYVDIYTASGVGVNMTFNVVLDEFLIGFVSWGDSDGAGSNIGTGGVPWFVNSTGGYVGLNQLLVGGPIELAGTVRIDVGTVSTGVYAAHGQTTVCHINFSDNFHVSIAGPITAYVRLHSARSLPQIGGLSTLGNIYISGFNLSIADNSWVDIWAH